MEAQYAQYGSAMLCEGVTELLAALAQNKEVKLSILSGNSKARSAVKLRSAGIAEFFTARNGQLRGAFGDEARTREGLIAYAQDRLVFDNDRMMVVDDSLIGAKMTKEHGIFAIMVATGSASAEELSAYSQYVFPDFGEVRWQQSVTLIENW